MQVELKKNKEGKFVLELPDDPIGRLPSVVEDIKKEVKSGWKTTEFWRGIVIEVIGLLAVLGVFTPDQADVTTQAATQLSGLVAMVASVFGYQISRGNAKK
jgi:hypothetical protein